MAIILIAYQLMPFMQYTHKSNIDTCMGQSQNISFTSFMVFLVFLLPQRANWTLSESELIPPPGSFLFFPVSYSVIADPPVLPPSLPPFPVVPPSSSAGSPLSSPGPNPK